MQPCTLRPQEAESGPLFTNRHAPESILHLSDEALSLRRHQTHQVSLDHRRTRVLSLPLNRTEVFIKLTTTPVDVVVISLGWVFPGGFDIDGYDAPAV